MPETDPPTSSEPTSAVLRPAEVAEHLGISAATLRRWSSRFGEFMELGDGNQDGGSHRRYTANDVATLARVQQLLEQGWTYEQVADRLAQGLDPVESVVAASTDQSVTEARAEAVSILPADTALVAAGAFFGEGPGLPEDALPPAARFLRDTMQAVTGTQQIILNSQQANRDMLGVMIQDNLNLKSENTGLRERMLELERELAELHRHFVDTRERTEIRMRVLEDAIAKLMAGQQAPPSRSASVPPPPRSGAAPSPVPPAPQGYPTQSTTLSYQPQGYAPQASPAYPPAGYTSPPTSPSSYVSPPYADQPPPPPKRGFWARLMGG